MKHKGILISDLHIGAVNPEDQYKEIDQYIFKEIKKVKPDFIIFLGDYFDHKASLNDKISYYSYLIFKNMVSLCTNLGLETKIRFVYGTESHEWNQYNIIETSDTPLDVKVIKYVSEEDLFEDMKVLYIPEEHIYSKEEYYKDYLTKPKYYDYIFGHGIIREVMQEAALSNDLSSSSRKKVPVFSSGELSYACRGQVYFGHYHIHTELGNDVFYVGSFDRWKFGEEEDKGFYEIEKDDDIFKETFIVNSSTKTYKTVKFGIDNAIYNDDKKLINKLDQIDSLVNDGVFNHIRFEFDIPSNKENPEFIMNYIKNRYKFNKKTKLKFTQPSNQKIKEDKEAEIFNKENAPLFDKNNSIEDRVSYFIGLEYHKDLKADKIKIYLNDSLPDIINKSNKDLESNE